jgi:predicted RecA/RadA family phage recombinase
MTQYSNQFSQTPEAGYLYLQNGVNNVLSCIHKTGETTALVAGQAVKIVDSYTAIPAVEAIDANTDGIFGFVVRNAKDADIPADARLEVARNGTTMFMTASAAIARGAKVQYAYTTTKVATADGATNVIGTALDKAGADGDVIRVQINIVTMALTDLTDVYVTSPSNTQVLKYDGATDNRWENAADAT